MATLVIQQSETRGVSLHGTTAHDGAGDILKRLGWRYSSAGHWFLAGPRSRSARGRLVEHTRRALEDLFEVRLETVDSPAPPASSVPNFEGGKDAGPSLAQVQALRERVERQRRHVARLERSAVGAAHSLEAAERATLALPAETEALARLEEELAAMLAAGADLLDAGTIAVGDAVETGVGWATVVKVNRQTVSVEAAGQVRKVRFTALTGHLPAGGQ